MIYNFYLNCKYFKLNYLEYFLYIEKDNEKEFLYEIVVILKKNNKMSRMDLYNSLKNEIKMQYFKIIFNLNI